MKRDTILIVDDEQSYLKTIAKYLDNSEYKVLQANNGKTGCKVAEKFIPDIIIMDWEMPEMNGIDAIKYLKSNSVTKHIPVIMATGVMTSAHHLETAMDAGAVDYIRKPIEEIELRARINSILKLSKSYQEIKRKNEQLKDLDREKDGMIGIVAHDLKSPLNKIKGFVQLLRLVDSDHERKVYLGMIEEVIVGGSNLIRDLLDSNAIEHQESKVDTQSIDIVAFFDSVAGSYKQILRKKKMTLDLDVENGLSIKSDEGMLLRIVDNLFSNAIKFSNQGSPVALKSFREGKNLTIQVLDQGPGISEEDQKKLFKKFQRLSAQPTAGESSTGLGLSIVKALVERLHGSINVESTLGEGSTFTVSIPLLHQDNPSLELQEIEA